MSKEKKEEIGVIKRISNGWLVTITTEYVKSYDFYLACKKVFMTTDELIERLNVEEGGNWKNE